MILIISYSTFLHFLHFLHQPCIIDHKMLMNMGRKKCCKLFFIISSKFLYKAILCISDSQLDSPGSLTTNTYFLQDPPPETLM